MPEPQRTDGGGTGGEYSVIGVSFKQILEEKKNSISNSGKWSNFVKEVIKFGDQKTHSRPHGSHNFGPKTHGFGMPSLRPGPSPINLGRTFKNGVCRSSMAHHSPYGLKTMVYRP
ncbi:hypothetical protein O181_007821 [Austropuccinia psidii MF-1]|uniref:Uncharacterized protein n=1 Tax=Austropuccinia psidii MF-1 TaxID=1389203 RepID=A0A9Q3BLJ8_9BASI|nr:hypothetical protein [Austropuccinia psidii MF-1]